MVTGSIAGNGTNSLVISGLDFDPQNICVTRTGAWSSAITDVVLTVTILSAGLNSLLYSSNVSGGNVSNVSPSKTYNAGVLTITGPSYRYFRADSTYYYHLSE